MFFGAGDPKTKNLNGKTHPHPALVFVIRGRELFVRALAENRRPNCNTHLRNAPLVEHGRTGPGLSRKHACAR